LWIHTRKAKLLQKTGSRQRLPLSDYH